MSDAHIKILEKWLISVGYAEAQIQTFPQYRVPKTRREIKRPRRVDLALFEDERRGDEHLLLIAECKVQGEYDGFDQLRSYMRACGVKVGIRFNGNDLSYLIDIPDAFDRTYGPEDPEFNRPNDVPDIKFGDYIRQRREALAATNPEMSVRKVARAIGVTGIYLSRIERNQLPPPRTKAITELANVLQEDPAKLLAIAGRLSSEAKEALLLRPRSLVPLIESLKNAPEQVLINLLRQVRDGNW